MRPALPPTPLPVTPLLYAVGWTVIELASAASAARKRLWWFAHNALVHPVLGVAPGCRWAWAAHDWTAERMGGQE